MAVHPVADPVADPDGSSASVLLVGGHESHGARGHAVVGPGGVTWPWTPPGRRLADAVRQAAAEGSGPVCAVPMTLGRDPALVADAARLLRRLASELGGHGLALTPQFGTTEHLITWLRAAAHRASAVEPDGPTRPTAILVTAPAADPFADAELFRVARLVRQYSPYDWVEVALEGGDPNLAAGVERCRRLGAERVLVVPASFDGLLPCKLAGAELAGPLLSDAALRRVVRARVEVAVTLLRQGHDGIRVGLDAEHGHGFTHSHAVGAGGHDHAHDHHHAAHHADHADHVHRAPSAQVPREGSQ